MINFSIHVWLMWWVWLIYVVIWNQQCDIACQSNCFRWHTSITFYFFGVVVLCLYRKVEVSINVRKKQNVFARLCWTCYSWSQKTKTGSWGWEIAKRGTIPKETTAKTTDNAKAKKVKEKQGAVAADKASTKRVREVPNKDKTDCDMGIEKPISTRPAKKSDPRRSPIARKTKTVTSYPHIK